VAAGITPAVLALALWLGTLMMFLTRGGVPTGAVWDQAPAGRRVLLSWISAVLVGAAQAALLLVLIRVIGIQVAHPVGLALFCGLGVLSFAAINQALVSLFGGIGRLVSLTFFAVEAAALGGLVPIETAPGFIQLLNGVLPLPQFVDGAGQLLLGGSTGGLLQACVILALWTGGALLVSTLATARKRPRLSTTPSAVPFEPVQPAPVPLTA
jgi:putative membrane protein